MKIIINAVVVASLLAPIAAVAQTDATGAAVPVKAKNTKKAKYVCPMDGYTSNKPGKCPKCGMDLVKQAAKSKPPQSSTKEVAPTAAKEPSAEQTPEATAPAKEKYACPMDGYTSDKPGKCPKCGMALQ